MLDGSADEAEVEAARVLFREYGVFLKATQSCGYFSHDRFVEEIAALPEPYTTRQGGLLLAYREGVAVGCVAYRISPTEQVGEFEIKRLYVRPAARGQGLARTLVERVLAVLRAAGCRRVTLDTDVETMPGARELYLSLGFAEYREREGTIAFLDRTFAGG